jgi:hypothetical protein
MSIAKSDGKMQFWDMGEPIVLIQTSYQTYTLQFWDMGEPAILGEIQAGGSFFLLGWGA